MDRVVPEPAYPYRELRRLVKGDHPPENTREETAAFVGLDLLAYVGGATREEVAEHIEGAGRLTPTQAEAIETALEFATLALDLRRESASNDDSPSGPREPHFEVLTALFVAPSGESGLGFADALRAHAGAQELATPTAPDAVTRFLLDHARASYAALLIKPPMDESMPLWRLTGVGRLPIDHEEHWRALLAEDLDLADIFRGLASVAAASRQYFDSSGQGGTLQAVFIPELIVRTAARRAGWPDDLGCDHYFDQVAAIVRELRSLISGETVEVPAWVRLSGCDVRSEFRLATALGELTATSAQPGVGAASGGSGTQLLLTITYPLSLEFDAPMGGPPPIRVFAAQREFQRRIDQLRLAFLLARNVPDPMALQVSSREVSNPLSWASINWPWSLSPLSLPLEEGEWKRVEDWSDAIARHHDPSIELAGRRALSASTPGREGEDRLVDAVIGLENLVGKGAGMTPARAFRETIGALFHDHPEGSQALVTRAAGLYRARSEIVHGRRELDVMEAERLRSDSQALLIEALRRLFGERPELIRDRRRARRLLEEHRDRDASAS